MLDVNKTASDTSIKSIEISGGVKAEIEKSQSILKPYQIAIYPVGRKQLLILNNHNNLWWLKFNKKEIQLQLQKDKKYRFTVHRLIIRKNILGIEE